jgi:hypothetical protein
MAHQRVQGEHASAFGEHKPGVDLQFEQPAGGPVLLVDPYVAEEGVRASPKTSRKHDSLRWPL